MSAGEALSVSLPARVRVAARVRVRVRAACRHEPP